MVAAGGIAVKCVALWRGTRRPTFSSHPVYDSKRGRLLLFGGADSPKSFFADLQSDAQAEALAGELNPTAARYLLA